MSKILPLRQREPHILVVEDDDLILQVLVAFIQMKITPNVDGVNSVWEAITTISHHRNIDLVVTDVGLAPVAHRRFQELDGIDLAGIVIRKWQIPVIVMTGYATEDRRIRAFQAGASQFFSKPVPFDALEDAIHRIFRGSG